MLNQPYMLNKWENSVTLLRNVTYTQKVFHSVPAGTLLQFYAISA